MLVLAVLVVLAFALSGSAAWGAKCGPALESPQTIRNWDGVSAGKEIAYAPPIELAREVYRDSLAETWDSSLSYADSSAKAEYSCPRYRRTASCRRRLLHEDFHCKHDPVACRRLAVLYLEMWVEQGAQGLAESERLLAEPTGQQLCEGGAHWLQGNVDVAAGWLRWNCATGHEVACDRLLGLYAAHPTAQPTLCVGTWPSISAVATVATFRYACERGDAAACRSQGLLEDAGFLRLALYPGASLLRSQPAKAPPTEPDCPDNLKTRDPPPPPPPPGTDPLSAATVKEPAVSSALKQLGLVLASTLLMLALIFAMQRGR